MIPMVSVHMITYNHERYLVQAIESVLAQKTSFDFEIVIGEDCSLDGTREIVQSYATHHPKRIRPILREQNIGMNRNFVETFLACNGRYIAFLEGDDHWISPHKLQKQVDELENMPAYVICSHPVQVSREGAVETFVTAANPRGEGSIVDLIKYHYPLPTAGVMLRGGLLTSFPEWFFHIHNCDYATQLLVARYGMIRYMSEPMAVYLKNANGVSELISVENQIDKLIELFFAVNSELNYRYDAAFRSRLRQLYLQKAKCQIRRYYVTSAFGSIWRSMMFAVGSRTL